MWLGSTRISNSVFGLFTDFSMVVGLLKAVQCPAATTKRVVGAWGFFLYAIVRPRPSMIW